MQSTQATRRRTPAARGEAGPARGAAAAMPSGGKVPDPGEAQALRRLLAEVLDAWEDEMRLDLTPGRRARFTGYRSRGGLG